MQRYIDADKIEYKTLFFPVLDGMLVRAKKLDNIVERQDIDNIPTADVQEVKHGKWIIRDGSRAFQYYDGTVSYEDCCCSRCGKWGYSDMKYCPHCGARMDGE